MVYFGVFVDCLYLGDISVMETGKDNAKRNFLIVVDSVAAAVTIDSSLCSLSLLNINTRGSMKISRRNPCSPFFSVSYSINRHKILIQYYSTYSVLYRLVGRLGFSSKG